jgi:IS5 family transposase
MPQDAQMYRRRNSQQLEFADFYLPFSGRLCAENRWVQLASLVPWQLAEEVYHADCCEDFGAPIVPARVALGALIIKERLGLTDRETVQTICENPFLQYFIGLEEFTQERPFDPSLMVEFRKRFGESGMQKISEAIALAAIKPEGQTPQEPAAQTQQTNQVDDDEPPSTPGVCSGEPAPADESAAVADDSAEPMVREPIANRGRLISDATCAPADVRYPTDISLLNEAREKTDLILDQLQLPHAGKLRRPRTYRRKARRDFLLFIKRKKPSRKQIRAARRKQLGYLGRNLRAIDQLLALPDALPLHCLGRRLYKGLLVCREVYRQQKEMHDTNSFRVDDRIVSISQPHVRPIKRGKAGRDTEFGAKLTLGLVEGFSFVDRLSWDNYNESQDLQGQIESYRERLGCYPESVHVDKIYRTRDNRAYCKARGIRISGPPLGRPRKDVPVAEKKQAREDELVRNAVEGKFGQCKRRFSLGRVMTKLASASQAQISLTFLVANLERAWRLLFCLLFLPWLRRDWPAATPYTNRRKSLAI